MDSFVKATAHAERELPTNMRRMQCLTVGRIVVKSKFQTCCPSPNCVAVARYQNQIGGRDDWSGLGGKDRTGENDAAKCQCK